MTLLEAREVPKRIFREGSRYLERRDAADRLKPFVRRAKDHRALMRTLRKFYKEGVRGADETFTDLESAEVSGAEYWLHKSFSNLDFTSLLQNRIAKKREWIIGGFAQEVEKRAVRAMPEEAFQLLKEDFDRIRAAGDGDKTYADMKGRLKEFVQTFELHARSARQYAKKGRVSVAESGALYDEDVLSRTYVRELRELKMTLGSCLPITEGRGAGKFLGSMSSLDGNGVRERILSTYVPREVQTALLKTLERDGILPSDSFVGSEKAHVFLKRLIKFVDIQIGFYTPSNDSASKAHREHVNDASQKIVKILEKPLNVHGGVEGDYFKVQDCFRLLEQLCTAGTRVLQTYGAVARIENTSTSKETREEYALMYGAYMQERDQISEASLAVFNRVYNLIKLLQTHPDSVEMARQLDVVRAQIQDAFDEAWSADLNVALPDAIRVLKTARNIVLSSNAENAELLKNELYAARTALNTRTDISAPLKIPVDRREVA